MIKTIQAYVLYRKDYGDDRDYSLSKYEMPTCGYITVSEVHFDVEVADDFDPRLQQIELLRKERERINTEFRLRCVQIEEQINRLTALEHTT